MIEPSPRERINQSIEAGQITFAQCKVIAQALPCFNKMTRVIKPGTSIEIFDEKTLDVSNCSYARISAGEDRLEEPASEINERFPEINHLAVPVKCAECKVFTPALTQLEALIPQKHPLIQLRKDLH